MNNFFVLALFAIINLLHFTGVAQTKKIDSLKLVLLECRNDTAKVKNLIELANEYTSINIDTSFILNKQASILTGQINESNDVLKRWKIKNSIQLGSQLGMFYKLSGDYAQATQNYQQQIERLEQLPKDTDTEFNKWIKGSKGNLYANIGVVYSEQGLNTQSLEYFFKGLKLLEEAGNIKQTAIHLGNMGLVYRNQNDYKKALSYFFKALKLNESINNKKSIAGNLNNIGTVYRLQGDNQKALEMFLQALKINEELGNKRWKAINIGNIGQTYLFMGDHNRALLYNEEALKMSVELSDKLGIARSLGNMGDIYGKMKEYKKAESYLIRAISLSDSIGVLELVKTYEEGLAHLYEATGRTALALEHFKKFMVLRDSALNAATQKKQMHTEMSFEFEKKELATKAEQDKKDAIALQEKKKQRIIIYSVSAGFFLVLLLALFIYKGLRTNQKARLIITKQKFEVESQKQLIEEKHKEIKDSINYAERIQRALLASRHFLDVNLLRQNNPGDSYFLFFKPKDIVSGDFYWASTIECYGKTKRFCLVTADSTGHGVPGAIMSMLNINSIKEAITKGLTEADDILNYARDIIINTLANDGSADGGKDGMDCSLIIFDFDKPAFDYVAANNPVWICRDAEVIELKPQKMPVGRHEKQNEKFVKQTFQLQKNDVVYTLTDGYSDQFGGNKGKKFMNKNLKELLKTNAHLPMAEQEKIIVNTFNNWIGNREQVDDITILGIRV